MTRSTAIRIPGQTLRHIVGLMALGPGLMLTGCATEPDITDDSDFGQSVRNMIALQTTDTRGTAPGMDAEKASAVLRTYRQQVADPKAMEQEMIDIELGD